MSDHNHSDYVLGCFRCETSRDESENRDQAMTGDRVTEAAARQRCDDHHWISQSVPGLQISWVIYCSICGAYNVDEMNRYTAASRDAALARVEALHQPVDAVMYSGSRQHMVKVCTGCGQDDGNWQRWPCPTIQAIRTHLGEKR